MAAFSADHYYYYCRRLGVGRKPGAEFMSNMPAWALVVFFFSALTKAQTPLQFAGVEMTAVNGPKISASGSLDLTTLNPNLTTSVWTSDRYVISGGFKVGFKFQIDISPENEGGEGFAFVIQGVGPNVLGTARSGLGYEGLFDAVVVEFDTFKSVSREDPNNNHISVHSNSRGMVTAHELRPGLLDNGIVDKICVGQVPVRPCVPNFRDGNVHEAVIQYEESKDPFKSQLLVFVDYMVEPTLRVRIDIPTELDLVGGRAYLGFTSSTGDSTGPKGAWERNAIYTFDISLYNGLGVTTFSFVTIALVGSGVVALGACIAFAVFRFRKLQTLGKGYQPLMTNDTDDLEKGESERVAARLFLRGSRDYSPQEVLMDIGHRHAKPAMLVKHDPSGDLRLMTALRFSNSLFSPFCTPMFSIPLSACTRH